MVDRQLEPGRVLHHQAVSGFKMGASFPGLTTFRWLYLVVFNMVWVFIPLWFLYEAYVNVTTLYASVPMETGKKDE